MAGYGAKYPCFAPIATEPEGSLPTYGAGAYIGKLNLANLTVTLASGEAWGDDELAEQISEFASGSLAMETLDMEDKDVYKRQQYARAAVPGHEPGA